jgi:hypothetical protein
MRHDYHGLTRRGGDERREFAPSLQLAVAAFLKHSLRWPAFQGVFRR